MRPTGDDGRSDSLPATVPVNVRLVVFTASVETTAAPLAGSSGVL